MTRKPLYPYGNTCRVEVELPWEIADLIVEHGPSLILAISSAVSDRKRSAERQEYEKAKLRATWAERKAETLVFGEKVQSEIVRRTNGPGQRPVLIKQLAAEYGYSAKELSSILRVYREHCEERKLHRQHLRALTLHLQGFKHKEIGEKLDLSSRRIGSILRSSNLLDSIKEALADVKKENSGGSL